MKLKLFACIAFIAVFAVAYSSSAVVFGHSPSEVFPGTFQIGNYNFPNGTLTVNKNVTSGIAISAYGRYKGVYGQANDSVGYGVYGAGWQGVYGTSSSSGGRGVYGYNSRSTGTAYGVYGESASVSGYGVYGRASASTGTNYGVLGISDSNQGYGVYGYASSSTGTVYGVYGQALSSNSNGIGVFGIGNGTGVSGRGTYGVYGYSGASAGRGVYGYHSGTVEGWGVYAQGNSNYTLTDRGALYVYGNEYINGLTNINCLTLASFTQGSARSSKVTMPFSCIGSGCTVVVYEDYTGTSDDNMDSAYYYQYVSSGNDPMISFGAAVASKVGFNGDSTSEVFAQTIGPDCKIETGNAALTETQWNFSTTGGTRNCTLIVCG